MSDQASTTKSDYVNQSIRFDAQLIQRVDALAKKRGVTRSKMIQELLQDGIDYKETPKPLLSAELQKLICFEVLDFTDSLSGNRATAFFDRVKRVMNEKRKGSASFSVVIVSMIVLIIVVIAIGCIIRNYG